MAITLCMSWVHDKSPFFTRYFDSHVSYSSLPKLPFIPSPPGTSTGATGNGGAGEWGPWLQVADQQEP